MRYYVDNRYAKSCFLALLFIMFISTYSALNASDDGGDTHLPIFQFTKEGSSIITIIGTCHAASLQQSLTGGQIAYLLHTHEALYIEHDLKNMALDFVKADYSVTVEEGEENLEKKLLLSPLVNRVKFFFSNTAALIKGFDYSGEEIKLLEAALPATAEELITWKPWILELLLSSEFSFRIMRETSGTELALAHRFAIADKDVIFLETPADIYTLEAYYKAEFSRQRFLGVLTALIDDMDFAIKKQEQTDMSGCTVAAARDVSSKHPASVSERNRSWIGKILAASTEEPDKPILVVVGFGHLSGEKGLIKLLEDQGFEINVL